MNYIGDPANFLGTVGPPTRIQPEWEGVGYKHLVYDTSPVGHIIAPDGLHHQMINIHAEKAHLPLEGALLDYIGNTGYNPQQFQIPEHLNEWYQQSEQFGFPDSRPGSVAMVQPREARPSDYIETATGVYPIRDATEASLPRKPR